MIVNKEKLASAIWVATVYHDKQFDKGGSPYILHPLWVMHNVSAMCKPVAVCHDVVEDTQLTIDELVKIVGFDTIEKEALMFLTHLKGVSYVDYIVNLARNSISKEVKIADLTHNMKPDRIKSANLTEKDLARIEKYHRAYLFLNGRLSEDEYT